MFDSPWGEFFMKIGLAFYIKLILIFYLEFTTKGHVAQLVRARH